MLLSTFSPSMNSEEALSVFNIIVVPLPGISHGRRSLVGCRSQTQLSDFHFHALEKAMATHSSVLAWRIPGTREPGGLPSVGSHGVEHNRSDLAAAAAALSSGSAVKNRPVNPVDAGSSGRSLEKEWQPIPVFLPGESQGRQSLVLCRLWGRTESDTTEAT